MRRRIEGGAPPSHYRREHGRPQYSPDWYDSPHTYPQWALEEWWCSEEARYSAANQWGYLRHEIDLPSADGGAQGRMIGDMIFEHLVASSAARD